LQPAAAPIRITQGEIYDATFSASTVRVTTPYMLTHSLTDISNKFVVATTVNLLVYSVKTTASEKGKEKASAPITAALELIQTVDRPTLPGNFTGSSFRAARFHPTEEHTLYTVMNTVPPRTRTKHSPYTSFVCKWNTDTWEVVKVRKISDKRATCFAARSVNSVLVIDFADHALQS
jgi:prolactin regulatory element-binding protein